MQVAETRELTAEETNHVSGGFWGEICLIVGAVSLAIDVIAVADAKGAFNSVPYPPPH